MNKLLAHGHTDKRRYAEIQRENRIMLEKLYRIQNRSVTSKKTPVSYGKKSIVHFSSNDVAECGEPMISIQEEANPAGSDGPYENKHNSIVVIE